MVGAAYSAPISDEKLLSVRFNLGLYCLVLDQSVLRVFAQGDCRFKGIVLMTVYCDQTQTF
jgi:hypothetical protein